MPPALGVTPILRQVDHRGEDHAQVQLSARKPPLTVSNLLEPVAQHSRLARERLVAKLGHGAVGEQVREIIPTSLFHVVGVRVLKAFDGSDALGVVYPDSQSLDATLGFRETART